MSVPVTWWARPARLPVAVLALLALRDAVRGAAFWLADPDAPRAAGAACDLLAGVAGLAAAGLAWRALETGAPGWRRVRAFVGLALGLFVAANLVAVMLDVRGGVAAGAVGGARGRLAIGALALSLALHAWLARWWWRLVSRAAG